MDRNSQEYQELMADFREKVMVSNLSDEAFSDAMMASREVYKAMISNEIMVNPEGPVAGLLSALVTIASLLSGQNYDLVAAVRELQEQVRELTFANTLPTEHFHTD